MARKAKDKEGPLIKNILKHVLKGISEKGAGINEAWDAAAGEDAAGHTKILSLKRGRLVINVSDSSRLFDLTMRKKQLIEQMNEKDGKRRITEIRFKIGIIK